MKRGFYLPKVIPTDSRATDHAVRAIYYPSFEEEVVVEDFNGVYTCTTVDKFLEHHEPTNQTFKPKQQRVKDGRGSGTGGY